MNLVEQQRAIRSRSDFVAFVRMLAKDYQDNPETWVNLDLDRFLEALGAWIEDMDGYYQNQKRAVPDKPDWNVVGDMLMAARVYE